MNRSQHVNHPLFILNVQVFSTSLFSSFLLFEDHRTDWKLFRFAKCIVFNYFWLLTIVLTLLTLIFFALLVFQVTFQL